MSIPEGPHIIKCIAYADRVADLSKARLNNAVIGFHQHNGFNQRWTFNRQGSGANEYKIFTTTQDSQPAFAHTSIQDGAIIVGRSFSGTFIVEQIGPHIRISPKEDPGLCWTLEREGEETPITLRRFDGRNSQKFVLLPV